MTRPIGLIAGNRSLPLMAAEKARALGRPLAVAALAGEAAPEIRGLADYFVSVKLGQMRVMIDFFLGAGVRDVVMIGGISRETIILNYEPDEVALEITAGLTDFHTDKILKAVCARLESEGLHLRSAADLLPELLPPPGLLTRKSPDAEMTADLKVAWRIAKELGRLDVGQCAVVSDRITLAVEAAEGTDATVARGGALARKPVAVAKVVKPMQDLRLDPPVIGPDTIRAMAAANVGAVAVDASKVLVVNLDETIRLADEAGLALVAWTDESAS
ncbi:MAG: UDP-2,3-diacylglucosamine diphosphatase LpxI [Candidatus Adiutrix sp.]|jgi:DUF1009 family protein|nr:UDP-2,3-diacylglucosamine diphosphatase LpxI [Candidatus Adiutrix sp.]